MYRKIWSRLAVYQAKIRSLHYRRLFGSFGAGSRVNGNITVYSPENIFLGELSSINSGVVLNARDKITIGNHVHISPGVIINTGTLDYTKKGVERTHLKLPVVIGDGVWLASGVIVNPGVTIGENTVVGAGAVVTKDLPANCVAIGIPAKVFKEL